MPQSSISLETLAQYFHLPITEVARKLGVCATVLKKICRKNGIPRWPHRKIKRNLRLALSKNPDDAERLEDELRTILARKEQLMKNPSLFAVSKSGGSRYKGSGSHGKRKGQRATSGSASDDSFDSPSSFEVTYNQPAPSPVISSAISTRRKSINSTLAAMDFQESQQKASPVLGAATPAMEADVTVGEAPPKRIVRFALPQSAQDEDEDSDVDIEDGDDVMADDEEEEDENEEEEDMMQDTYEERIELPTKRSGIVTLRAPVEGPGGETLQSATPLSDDREAAEQGNISPQETSAWSDSSSPNSIQRTRRRPANRNAPLPQSPTRIGADTPSSPVHRTEAERRTQYGRVIRPPRHKSISAISRPYSSAASLAQQARRARNREKDALAPRWQQTRVISREEDEESDGDEFDEGEEEEGAKLMTEMRYALYQQQKERQQAFMSALWQQQQEQQMAVSQYLRRHSFPAAYPYPGYFPVYSGADGSPSYVYYVPAPPPPASYSYDIRRSSMMYVPPVNQMHHPATADTTAPAAGVQPDMVATSPRANIEPSEHSAFAPVSPRSGDEPSSGMVELKLKNGAQATQPEPIAAPVAMVPPKVEETIKSGSPPPHFEIPSPSAPMESPAPTPSPPLQFFPGVAQQYPNEMPTSHISPFPMVYPSGMLAQSTAYPSPYWYQQQRYIYPQMMMAQQPASSWGYPVPYGIFGAPNVNTNVGKQVPAPVEQAAVPSNLAPKSPVADVPTPVSPKNNPVIWHSPYTMAVPPPGASVVEETKPTPPANDPIDADSMQVCEPESEVAVSKSSPLPPPFDSASLSGGEVFSASTPSGPSASSA